MLGSKSAQAIEDMVGYAQETQHEKILRGLAVGIALVMYGRMEEADALIESLCRDKVRRNSHQNHVIYSIRSKGVCGQVQNHVFVAQVNLGARPLLYINHAYNSWLYIYFPLFFVPGTLNLSLMCWWWLFVQT